MIKFICKKCGREVEIKKYKDDICFACKRKETMKKRYGVENPFQLDYVKEKIKQTNLERYGVVNPGQIKVNKKNKEEKRIKTNLEKYGVRNPLELKEIQEKIEKTNLEKYGFKRAIQNEKYKQKMYNTNLEKYGTKIPSQNTSIKNKSKRNIEKTLLERADLKKKNFIKNLLNNLEDVKPLFDIKDYHGIAYNNKYRWECLICGTKFQSILYGGRRPMCPICNKKNIYHSSPEDEIAQFLHELNIKYIMNARNIISPYELDIYLPDYNIAIEFDGLYWHSDIYKDENYHLKKTEDCNKKNIELIHIFENEWLYKRDIVKNRLKYKLNIIQSSIGARQTIIKEINHKIKDVFLNTYHLQGTDKSSIKLGAYYKNELVGVMTFSNSRIFMNKKYKEKTWELSRFATSSNYRIYGLASKMLTYFERNYNWNEIYSYADRRWSQGDVYYKLKFIFQYYTKPNYWYWDGRNLNHRYKYRKDELKNMFSDLYEDKKTEKEIMDEAGYLRIYDCGNIKFSKLNTKNCNI